MTLVQNGDTIWVTMKIKLELSHAANYNINMVVKLLEPIKEQYHTISYDDFYQDFTPL